MHLERLKNIAESKIKALEIKKESEYKSKKTGVRAAVFLTSHSTPG